MPKKPRGGIVGFLEQRRHTIIHVCLSGITVMLSMSLVNNAHKAEDNEAELRAQLQEEARVRKALLRRAPKIAIESGLPPSAESAFERALYHLEGDIIDEDPSGIRATAGSGSETGKASLAPQSTAMRKVAVW